MAITTPQTNPRTILLRGELHKVQTEGYVQATKSIIPGMLVEPGTGGANPYKHYQPHATQGEVTEPLVALEPMIADVPFATFQGGTIDDTYAAGDHLRVIEGDFLQSAGNGDLEKVTTTNARLFTALEAKTPTAARTRVRVRRV
jgi:hypothetical protein